MLVQQPPDGVTKRLRIWRAKMFWVIGLEPFFDRCTTTNLCFFDIPGHAASPERILSISCDEIKVLRPRRVPLIKPSFNIFQPWLCEQPRSAHASLNENARRCNVSFVFDVCIELLFIARPRVKLPMPDRVAKEFSIRNHFFPFFRYAMLLRIIIKSQQLFILRFTQWDNISAVLHGLTSLRPIGHHLHSLGPIFSAVICASDVIVIDMGQLAFNRI